jgi:phenylalanyl-tRNA synthetase beta chain
VVGGVVKNVELTDDIVASLMQVQEKLHTSLCRNRRKGSIGVYDLDRITPPIRYTTTLPDGIKFLPLEFDRELTPRQILQKHPKGIEYAHLLRGLPRYPLLIDSKGVVLSLPPIINSEDTRVTERTKNLFIDVTGVEEQTINRALNVLMTSLAERGFRLFSTVVKYPTKKILVPNLKPKKYKLSVARANEFIGLDLKPAAMAKIAKRMRYGVQKMKDGTLTLLAPPYRTDIMHEVDLIEDIAIGYGYDQLEPTLPSVVTTGEQVPIEKISQKARKVLTGLGFMETMGYTLTNPRKNFELMRQKGRVVEIANPVSEEYTILRDSLLPSLLSALYENRRRPIPQKLFEVGDVVLLDPEAETGAKETRRAAGVVIGKGASFTYVKNVAEALLRELGLSWEVKSIRHPSFLDGRVVEFSIDGKKLGVAGELHPEVVLGFELEHPVAAFELELE